ncbi:hypothetical protein CDG76_15770 [Nostoc sp. 'Peltigera membranacea cyanobiont' 210A]|nr:hypothetical protein CDG76_15770 [Nostoc sp. 'Peltigera membranacea cyanobiont' 210A]
MKSLQEKKRVWSTGQALLISAAVVVGAIAIYKMLYPLEWTGFGPDSNDSVTTKEVINPKDGRIIKLTEISKDSQPAKTLWDWLGLAGTLAIPVILFQFQRSEQQQAEERAALEKQQVEERAALEKLQASERAALEREIATTNFREEALEVYIDRMSELLIDKKFKLLLDQNLEQSHPKYSQLDAALNIARARTLSVLRRLDKDGERKGSVIRFLIDAELISKLNLSDANLESAYLESACLENANLKSAIFIDANLWSANLKSAIFIGACFSSANLSSTNLWGACLEGACLSSANLSSANLENANLEDAYLSSANLENANLSSANLENANLESTNLKSANLKSAKLEKATLNEETILPDGSKYQSPAQLAKFINPDTAS